MLRNTGVSFQRRQGVSFTVFSSKYHETFAYDAVGNITALTRNAGTPPAGGGSAGQVGSGPTMDNMTYSYDARAVTISLQQSSGSFSIPVLKSNRLYHVDDQVTGSYYSDDIDDQGSFNAAPSTINTANNYGYDELGNLVRDNAEEIANIGWNVSGKITSIIRTAGSKKPDLLYGYDFAGSRLFKVVIPKVQTGVNTGKRRSQEHWDTTWYIKDPSGNAMATYRMSHVRNHADTLKKRFMAEEYYIYGSNRHGTMRGDTFISEARFNWRLSNYGSDSLFTEGMPILRYFVGSGGYHVRRGVINYTQGRYQFSRGHKQYELSNHLGNVLTTIQDRKWGQNDSLISGSPIPFKAIYYVAYVATITDYYAFGSGIKERTASFTKKYRFGFNNQEQETELGDYYSFEYRVHDARLGRFLSVDPLAPEYPWNSTYAFAENTVIWAIELEGLEAAPTSGMVEFQPSTSTNVAIQYKFSTEGGVSYSKHYANVNANQYNNYMIATNPTCAIDQKPGGIHDLTTTEEQSYYAETYPNYQEGSVSNSWVAPNMDSRPVAAAPGPGIPASVGPVNLTAPGPIQDGNRVTDGGWNVVFGLDVGNYRGDQGVTQSSVGAALQPLILSWTDAALPRPFGATSLEQDLIPGENCLAPGETGMVENKTTQPMLYVQTNITILSITIDIRGRNITDAHRQYATVISNTYSGLLGDFSAFGISITTPPSIPVNYKTNVDIAQNNPEVSRTGLDFQVSLNYSFSSTPMTFNRQTTTYTSPYWYPDGELGPIQVIKDKEARKRGQ